jgi:hypothetical protein
MTRNDLLADLKALAISKREWETRAESAQYQFETIGLDAELHDSIIREGQELNEPNAFPAASASLLRVGRPHDQQCPTRRRSDCP